MARPRVFVSSTFYDLKQIRADLERFVREIGYEPVLHERGGIPYDSREQIEEHCYREVNLSDVVVSIIGGRFGTESQRRPFSISQVELRTATELRKPAFLFVENAVWAEYKTYQSNREMEGISYRAVDNIQVYRFLDEILSLPAGNPIAPFETAQDIISYLKEQWAGLFQRLLREQVLRQEIRLVRSLQETAQTLDELVAYLTEERRSQSDAIKSILMSNHPAFSQVKEVTNTPYRVFFANHREFADWIKVRGHSEVEEETWDDPDYEEWINEKRSCVLKISSCVFGEDGTLEIYTAGEWKQEWIKSEDLPPPGFVEENDIPF